MSDRLPWWASIGAKIGAHSGALGLDANDVSEFQGWATAETAEINAIVQRKQDYEEAVTAYRTNNPARMKEVRAAIARAKTASGYTEAIGEDLGWVGGVGDMPQPDSIQPVLEPSTSGGQVVLRFGKYGVDGLNIYARKRGTQDWKFLAFDSRSPYVDEPEEDGTYEYMAYAVVDGEQVGQPSAVVSVPVMVTP